MGAGGNGLLTSVKGSLFKHTAAVVAAAVLLGAALATNLAAFLRGMDTPWLLAGVILGDIVLVGVGIFIAAREVMVADRRSEASEARLAAIVDSAMDAIVTVDQRQEIVHFNRAAEQLFGCTQADALGSPLERFIPQRYRGAHKGHVENFGKRGTTSRRMGDMSALWALRADGTEFPIEASISQATEGAARYFTVILRDITRRKKFEDSLQRSQQELRELSARVLQAREDEKTHIARELHDELGQMLTALKMDLAEMRRSVPPGNAQFETQATEMNALLDKTVSATRRISADLRPLMLDDLGLPDAANWLVVEFGKRSGVVCDIRLTDTEQLQGAPKNVATAMYRALQESLTNIARHSGARHAWIIIGVQDGRIHMEVEDDGRGIAAEDLAKATSLGLKGMRERFAYIGGALAIDPAPRGGTRLRVHAPLQAAPREPA